MTLQNKEFVDRFGLGIKVRSLVWELIYTFLNAFLDADDLLDLIIHPLWYLRAVGRRFDSEIICHSVWLKIINDTGLDCLLVMATLNSKGVFSWVSKSIRAADQQLFFPTWTKPSSLILYNRCIPMNYVLHLPVLLSMIAVNTLYRGVVIPSQKIHKLLVNFGGGGITMLYILLFWLIKSFFLI